MKRVLASLALILAGSAAADDGPRRTAAANPGEVVASELAFNRLAREKGQWTAFLATAAEGAKMFAPQPVLVAAYLQKRANPPVSVAWQPHQVWSSCDGTYAVTRGGWQQGGESGYFITVWQRQRKGGYKWVLDQGDTLPAPLAEPEMIAALVAECPPAPAANAAPPPPSAPKGKPPVPPALDPLDGQSRDGSLGWRATVDASGARRFTLQLRQDGVMREVLAVSVAAPALATGG